MARETLSLESALAEFSSVFRRAHETFDPADSQCSDPPFALDGQAGAELRRLLPVEQRRRLGAFFTSHELAHRLAAPLAEARGEVVVVDASCGAGDLLLAAARALAPSLLAGQVGARLIGIDLVTEFVETAGLRLGMLGRSSGNVLQVELATADGRLAAELQTATHVLLNPPFAAVPASLGCSWAHGSVSGAADFLAAVTSQVPNGCHLAALLPEVLRGGSRYRRWREWIGKRIEIDGTESVGRFDRWTDIDVFILRGRRVDGRHTARLHNWVPVHTGTKVSDQFAVTVGPVVRHRHPENGPMRPFLTARNLPAWGTIDLVQGNRRFTGRTHSGPFVVIPRTSRPDEKGRARATVVTDIRPVAVDNHLLVLTPIHGDVDSCQSLLSVLRSPTSDAWLDQAIRCRHLTVSAIATVPWNDSQPPLPASSGCEAKLT